MGVIVDSSVLIAAERRDWDASEVLGLIGDRMPGERFAVSVITLAELARGVARANSPQRARARQGFVDDVERIFEVHPVNAAIARRAGLIDGESTTRGIQISFADLLIGVTALELGFAVATGNVRHFERVPGLKVIAL